METRKEFADMKKELDLIKALSSSTTTCQNNSLTRSKKDLLQAIKASA